jgi:TPR repeat protein
MVLSRFLGTRFCGVDTVGVPTPALVPMALVTSLARSGPTSVVHVPDTLTSGGVNRMPEPQTLHTRGRGRVSPRRALRVGLLAALVLVASCNPGAEEARELRSSCAQGDTAACTELGYRVMQGQNVLRDWRRAAELFGHACDGGNAEGCVRLASMHVHDDAENRGVSLDSTLAADLLERGCHGGAMRGCAHLAEMYLADDSITPDVEPTGPVQDLGRAVALYRRACDGEDFDACASLGLLHQEGTGLDADVPRAAALYRQACDGGSMLGCAHLGVALERGRGLERDVSRAAELYEQACEVEMTGCFHLADLHTRGEAVDQDYDRAVELLGKACRGTMVRDEGSKPLAESCFRLAEMNANGAGIERNLGRAGYYFRRACRLGMAEACRR